MGACLQGVLLPLVSGSSSNSPQRSENGESGRASIVFSCLEDDPHGQVRCELASSQRVTDQSTWESIEQIAKEKLRYTRPSPRHSPKKDPVAETADQLLAALRQRHPNLRFEYKALWIDWCTEASGRRILDPDAPHWEHALYIINPSGPLPSREAQQEPTAAFLVYHMPHIEDPRRAVEVWRQGWRFPPLAPLPPLPLPSPSSSSRSLVGRTSEEVSLGSAHKTSKSDSSSERSTWFSSDHCFAKRYLAVVHKLQALGILSQPSQSDTLQNCRSSDAPRKWYRVFALGDDLRFFVRPEAGPNGTPGLSQSPAFVDTEHGEREEGADVKLVRSQRKSRLRRWWSVPDFVDRDLCLEEPAGFECDAFRNCCRICYEQPIEIIVLPCRHGGMCMECVRKTLYSRPSHRGGRMCPFCRKNISEVLRIYWNAALPQYAYSVKIGQF